MSMKRTDSELMSALTRKKSLRFLIVLGFLYILLVVFEVPLLLKNGPNHISLEAGNSNLFLTDEKSAATLRPERKTEQLNDKKRKLTLVSTLNLTAGVWRGNETSRTAKRAIALGRAMWLEVESTAGGNETGGDFANRSKSLGCPSSISVGGGEFSGLARLPCGLALGSHVTVIGKPRGAHNETVKDEDGNDDEYVMVSRFTMELLGLKMAESESPPKILHINPRLKGDWSGSPVIEINNCYRMNWGTPQRCAGREPGMHEETVDGLLKCERWHRDSINHLDELNLPLWITDLIGPKKKKKGKVSTTTTTTTTTTTSDRPFPFEEGKLFVLTLSAGVEGYHINVDGRHVASFKYRDRFGLEDATGLYLGGDIDVVSIFAGSLPALRPAYAHKHLNLSERFKAPPIPNGPVELFIGILSAGSHFAERMAIRKTWMRHELIRSSRVVARFIVALHARKEVNLEVKKEAEFFGDIVIVPFMDHYDLVVLKTVAIVEFGVRTVSAKYIMKGDDDTFIRVDAITNVARRIEMINKSFYTGNMNYHHQPLRSGKWAVTEEEWHAGFYPTYANGPGYIISSDIANFILSEYKKKKLKLFKMEDVSMGIWVKKFSKSTSTPVEYIHSLKYCQYGCVEGYVTAHYQSPRLMLCLWDKLRKLGKASCCNRE